MKVILCGYNWAGCKALDILVSLEHDIFVFTHDGPYHVPSLIDLCRKVGVSYSIENISRSTLPFIPDVICSIYYRYIIKKPVIDICDGKIFNLHPSLLPKYRGCSSLTWALINGEPETGFSYHYIDEGCDTGNVLLQKKIKIEEWDTQQTLYMRTMFESMVHFSTVLKMVLNGEKGEPQTGEATYFPRECPFGGIIDANWDLLATERFIRAMNYPPYPPARFNDENIYTLEQFINLKKVNDE
jgi:methionyl-tRNA formyltransferase